MTTCRSVLDGVISPFREIPAETCHMIGQEQDWILYGDYGPRMLVMPDGTAWIRMVKSDRPQPTQVLS